MTSKSILLDCFASLAAVWKYEMESSMFWSLVYVKQTKQFSPKWNISVTLTTLHVSWLRESLVYTSSLPKWTLPPRSLADEKHELPVCRAHQRETNSHTVNRRTQKTMMKKIVKAITKPTTAGKTEKSPVMIIFIHYYFYFQRW